MAAVKITGERLSLRDEVAALSPEEQAEWASRFDPEQLEKLRQSWHWMARKQQLDPPGDWFVHLILTGRGWGKTWSASNRITDWMMDTPGVYACIAPTYGDLLRVTLPAMEEATEKLPVIQWNRQVGQMIVVLENGSKCHLVSGEKPDRLRGLNLSGAWLDEAAMMSKIDILWNEVLLFALRKGNPRVIVTTTPKPIPWLRKIHKDPKTVVTTGSSFDNAANLTPEALQSMKELYEGTREGQQELYGQILDDVKGALWHYGLFRHFETEPMEAREDCRYVCIGVDPSGSGKGDRTGMVVAGLGKEGADYRVLADLSDHMTPDQMVVNVCRAYHDWMANEIALEHVGQAGAWMDAAIKRHDPTVRVVKSRCYVGKQLRAEPVVGPYEQGRVWHARGLGELEIEMTSWVPEGPDRTLESPDRVDALVHALTKCQDRAGYGRAKVWKPDRSRVLVRL